MRGRMVVGVAVAGLLAAGAAYAQRGDGDGCRRGPMREKMLEKFDANGDGVLSPEEKAAAREWFRANRPEGAPEGPPPGPPPEGFGGHRGHMKQRFDTDGDGIISPEEKAAAKEWMQQNHPEAAERMGGHKPRMMEQFDTDGDGVLSPEEKTAAKEWMQQNHPEAAERMRGHKAHMMEQFDTDGDGVLSPEEKAAAKEWMQQNHPQGCHR